MAGPYWIKWQTSKWLTDPELSNCAPATRGIWADLLNRIYELDKDGSITGTPRSLSQQTRCQIDEFEAALEEIELFNVADISRTDGGLITITSRHAQRYLRKKKKDRERKRAERAEDDDDDGQNVDNSRTTNGQSTDTHAGGQKNSSSSSSSDKEKKRKARFVSTSPPELDEVKAYFTEQNAPEEEAEKFVDHFTSQGWKLANGNPMKDWQASVRQWVRRIPEFKARGSPSTSPMTYHEALRHSQKLGISFPGSKYEKVEQEHGKPLWRYTA